MIAPRDTHSICRDLRFAPHDRYNTLEKQIGTGKQSNFHLFLVLFPGLVD